MHKNQIPSIELMIVGSIEMGFTESDHYPREALRAGKNVCDCICQLTLKEFKDFKKYWKSK